MASKIIRRRDLIQQVVQERGGVSVGALAEMLGVSTQTIRRDLDVLCDGETVRRAPANTTEAVQLSLLGQLALQVLERYYVTVALLLKRGADAGAADREDGMTPLHHASAKGHPDIVRQLIEAGADPNMKSKAGAQPRDPARRARSQS